MSDTVINSTPVPPVPPPPPVPPSDPPASSPPHNEQGEVVVPPADPAPPHNEQGDVGSQLAPLGLAPLSPRGAANGSLRIGEPAARALAIAASQRAAHAMSTAANNGGLRLLG